MGDRLPSCLSIQKAAPDVESIEIWSDRMESWSLDGNQLLQSFRTLAAEVKPESDAYYHLFFPPPYAPTDRPVSDWFFVSKKNSPQLLIRYSDQQCTVELRGKEVRSVMGFKKQFKYRIWMSSTCSSDGLKFMIYELENNFFEPKEVPILCDQILKCANSPNASSFLTDTLSDPDLRQKLEQWNTSLLTAEVDESNRMAFIRTLSEYINSVAALVFANPETKDLPMGVKRALNLLIFNAITSKSHYMLMVAYNAAFLNENVAAQHAARVKQSVNIDYVKMEKAVKKLHGILHLPSPIEMINCLVLFFDEMVEALPGKEVAADDILPAICLATTRDYGFGSHVVSFFNYLMDIWPQTGLDERVTYILVTCTIAAQHLATMDGHEEAPAPVEVGEVREKTEETIGMLEDLLSFL
jgi:hypothetical protein